jgi:hypothetical protein
VKIERNYPTWEIVAEKNTKIAALESQVAALTKERDELAVRFENADLRSSDRVLEDARRIAALTKERDEAEAALLKFGSHRRSCLLEQPGRLHDDISECSCGYQELLVRIHARTKEPTT